MHPDRQDHQRCGPHGVPDRRVLPEIHRRDVRPVLDGAGACENTNKIAEQCNFEFTFGETKLPYFKAPDGMENQEYFEKLCWDGLERRYPGRVTDALKERLTYEINVVKTMATRTATLSSTTYQLRQSHDNPRRTGPRFRRGHLAAYCVGITDIDPIRYNLIFERFLNPERVSMPDLTLTSATSAVRRSLTTSTRSMAATMWPRS